MILAFSCTWIVIKDSAMNEKWLTCVRLLFLLRPSVDSQHGAATVLRTTIAGVIRDVFFRSAFSDRRAQLIIKRQFLAPDDFPHGVNIHPLVEHIRFAIGFTTMV